MDIISLYYKELIENVKINFILVLDFRYFPVSSLFYTYFRLSKRRTFMDNYKQNNIRKIFFDDTIILSKLTFSINI